jgi:short-subunit dehydrogenase
MRARVERKIIQGERLMDSPASKPLALVTGASCGIGYELAKLCAENGFDLVIAADRPEVNDVVQAFSQLGTEVVAVEADLATLEGVDQMVIATRGRHVDALIANAGHGLGRAFLEQDFAEVRHVIDTNVTGTIYLVQKVGSEMSARGHGRILIVGSVAGFIPGPFQAVYNGTKAFINSFSIALRNELKGSGVTVTCLMPGATDTDFFERARLLDTKLGHRGKDNPAKVAKDGFDAMMKGEASVVSGWQNKLKTTFANVTPAGLLAELHRRMVKPLSGKE